MDTLKKTIIYKIKDVKYIGSTQTRLLNRLHAHRHSCYNPNRRHHHLSHYKYIRKKKITIELIPIKILFLSSVGARLAEQKYIEKYNYVCDGHNYVNAFRFDKKTKQKILAKKWYEINKEKTKQRARDRYENNKEKILQQTKIRQKKNMKKIKARHAIKKKCNLCGCFVRQYGIKKHQRTDKCKTLSKIQHHN